MINIAHKAHIAPLPCAHTPLHAQKQKETSPLLSPGREGGELCRGFLLRHDEIYLLIPQ